MRLIAAHPSPQSRPPRRWLRRAFRLSFLAAALPAVGFLAFGAAVAWWPYPAEFDRAPPASTRIADRHGVPLSMTVADDDQWRFPLSEDQISPHLRRAIVAVEDARFYDHSGVDWQAAAGALRDNVSGLRIRRGASTLAMQVQRLRDPRPRTFANKFEQSVRAQQLDGRLGKQALLVEYLNRAPFGGNLVGAGAASWRYFGKPCAQLSLGEAALLAGLPKNPNRYRPDRFPDAPAARRAHVLGRMVATGVITQTQADEARAEPIAAHWHDLPQARAGSSMPPADGAMPTLIALAGKHPGRAITSTLDAAVQRQAAVATLERVRLLNASGVTAAAVVVLDTRTAECLAAVSVAASSDPTDRGTWTAGGLDFTRRPRSTGSVLKPLIYAAAFDAGLCGPETQLVDAPASWPGYVPANYDRTFRGAMSAGDALAESRNIPAMLVLSKVGVERAVGVMDAAGLHTPGRSARSYGLSLAVGGAEATPLEVAEAYAALGRGGESIEVSFVASSDGGPPKRFLRAQACWQTLSALSVPSRTSALNPEAARRHVAWKTGTSSGNHDAWCAAVTPKRTVVVWLGNPHGEGSAALVGRDAAAPLALELIVSLDAGTPQPWPAVDLVASSEAAKANFATPSRALTLISPTEGQTILLSPDLPADRQRLLLKASAGRRGGDASDDQLWWFVDGEPTGTSRPDEPFWWTPLPGTHEVRVTDGRGRSDRSTIRVVAGE